MHVLDHGAVGQHRPPGPTGRVDLVPDRIDDELLGLAEPQRFTSTVVHRGGDLAGRPPHLARLEAGLHHRDGEHGADRNDDEHDRDFDEGKGAFTSHPTLPSQLVTSRLSPSPPGAPSAPYEKRSYGRPASPGLR